MYIGIDPSLTGTGLAAVNGEKSAHRVIQTKQKGLKRMKLICEEVHEFLDRHDAKIVCIEGFSYYSRGRAVYEIAGLGYLIRMMLYDEGYVFHEVPPATLKKFATGKGNAKKHEVAVAAHKKWGFEASTEDEIDAFVLAKIAEDMSGINLD